jgi:hypothetical protein
MAAFLAAAKRAKNNVANGEGSSISNTIQSVTSTKIDCPFNLDDIFAADVERFTQLKDVIKFIFANLEKHTIKTQELEMKMVSKFMEISQIKAKCDETVKTVEDVKVSYSPYQVIFYFRTSQMHLKRSHVKLKRTSVP